MKRWITLAAVALALGACKKPSSKPKASAPKPKANAGQEQCASLDASALRLVGLGPAQAEQLTVDKTRSFLRSTIDPTGRPVVQMLVTNTQTKNDNLRGNYALFVICKEIERDWRRTSSGNICQTGRIDTMEPGVFLHPTIEIRDEDLSGDVYAGVTTCLDESRRDSEHGCQPEWTTIPGHITLPPSAALREVRLAMAENRQKRASIVDSLIPHAKRFIARYKENPAAERPVRDRGQSLLTAAYNIAETPSAAREFAISQFARDAEEALQQGGGAQLADGTGSYPCPSSEDLKPAIPPAADSGGNSPLANGAAAQQPPSATLPSPSAGTQLPAATGGTGVDLAGSPTPAAPAAPAEVQSTVSDDDDNAPPPAPTANDRRRAKTDKETKADSLRSGRRLPLIDPKKFQIGPTSEPRYVMTDTEYDLHFDDDVHDDKGSFTGKARFCFSAKQAAQSDAVVAGTTPDATACRNTKGQEVSFRLVQEVFTDSEGTHLAPYYQLLLGDGANCLKIHEDDSDPAQPKFALRQTPCLDYGILDGESADISQLFEVRRRASDRLMQIGDLGGSRAQCLQLGPGQAAAPFVTLPAGVANYALGLGSLTVASCSDGDASQWLKVSASAQPIPTRPPKGDDRIKARRILEDNKLALAAFVVGVVSLMVVVVAVAAGGFGRVSEQLVDNKFVITRSWFTQSTTELLEVVSPSRLNSSASSMSNLFSLDQQSSSRALVLSDAEDTATRSSKTSSELRTSAKVALGAMAFFVAASILFTVAILNLADDPVVAEWDGKLRKAGEAHLKLLDIYDKLSEKEAKLVQALR